MSLDLLLGVISFSGIILLLVVVIILARSQLVSTGNVSIEINGDSENPIVVPAGSKLLTTLADNNIFLASACGGGGTCSQCKCQVFEGGGSILAAEESHFNSTQKKDGLNQAFLKATLDKYFKTIYYGRLSNERCAAKAKELFEFILSSRKTRNYSSLKQMSI